jgi:hypothetical protein
MKLRMLSFVMLFWVITGYAQSTATIEIFGGYSFSRIAPENLVARQNMNGATLNLAYKFMGGFGIAADFGIQKGKKEVNELTATTFMAGPHFGREGKRLAWFGHSLYGVTKLTTLGITSRGGTSKSQKINFSSIPFGTGIDIKFNEKVAWRVLQFDLLFLTRGYPTPGITLRLSTGLVIRLGRK